MSAPLRMRWNAGPFSLPHWLYRLGFDWQWECALQPGWTQADWAIPAWAKNPSAGIIGDWQIIRSRLTWRGLPLTRWLDGKRGK